MTFGSGVTSIQARVRCHPTIAAAARHPMLVEHEYEGGGAPPVSRRLGRPPYKVLAQPFEWKFTRADLARLLERLARKDSVQLPDAA